MDTKTKIWNSICVMTMILYSEIAFFLLGLAPKGLINYFYYGNTLSLKNIIVSVFYYVFFYLTFTYLTEYLLGKNAGKIKDRFLKGYVPVIVIGLVLRLGIDGINRYLIGALGSHSMVTMMVMTVSELLFYFGSFLLMVYFVSKHHDGLKPKDIYCFEKKDYVFFGISIVLLLGLSVWNVYGKQQLAVKYFPSELTWETLTGLRVALHSSYSLTLLFAFMRNDFLFYVFTGIIIYMMMVFSTTSYKKAPSLERRVFLARILAWGLWSGAYFIPLVFAGFAGAVVVDHIPYFDREVHLGAAEYSGFWENPDKVLFNDNMGYLLHNKEILDIYDLKNGGTLMGVWDLENYQEDTVVKFTTHDLIYKYDFRYTFYCYDYMKKYDPEGIRPKLEQYARGEYSQEERRNARDELLDEMTEFSKKALEEMKQQHGQ